MKILLRARGMPGGRDRKRFFARLCSSIECGRSASSSDLAGARPILGDTGFFESHDRIRVRNHASLGNELFVGREI
jgi:hypothetical protein